MSNQEIRNVAFCPHCGNRAPQRLALEQQFQSRAYTMDGRLLKDDLPSTFYIAICETCNEILVYVDEASIAPGREYFTSSILVWPDRGQLGRAVPEKIREIYSEAFRIKSLAPNAFAVQIRRALEAITEDRGIKKGSLFERLKKLVNQGVLPPVLAEMTDLIRLLGNIGAHSNVSVVRPGHARVIDDFFRAIVEYVYVAPDKLERLKTNLGDLELDD